MIQAPVILSTTIVPVVEAASLLMTNVHESDSKAHRLAWRVGMMT